MLDLYPRWGLYTLLDWILSTKSSSRLGHPPPSLVGQTSAFFKTVYFLIINDEWANCVTRLYHLLDHKPIRLSLREASIPYKLHVGEGGRVFKAAETSGEFS